MGSLPQQCLDKLISKVACVSGSVHACPGLFAKGCDFIITG